MDQEVHEWRKRQVKFKDLPVDAVFKFANDSTLDIGQAEFQKHNVEPPQAIFVNPLDIDPEAEIELVE